MAWNTCTASVSSHGRPLKHHKSTLNLLYFWMVFSHGDPTDCLDGTSAKPVNWAKPNFEQSCKKRRWVQRTGQKKEAKMRVATPQSVFPSLRTIISCDEPVPSRGKTPFHAPRTYENSYFSSLGCSFHSSSPSLRRDACDPSRHQTIELAAQLGSQVGTPWEHRMNPSAGSSLKRLTTVGFGDQLQSHSNLLSLRPAEIGRNVSRILPWGDRDSDFASKSGQCKVLQASSRSQILESLESWRTTWNRRSRSPL